MEKNNLDERFSKLNEFSKKLGINLLNKRIYNLNLPDKYLKSLPVENIIYIHVKLHNALAYKKPFAPLEKIKEVHARIVKMLPQHKKVDQLDD